VQEAGECLLQEVPYLKQAGGSWLKNQVKPTSATADIASLNLRLINYSLVVAGTGPIDEWGIAGAREVYRALNLPTRGLCRSLLLQPVSAPVLLVT